MQVALVIRSSLFGLLSLLALDSNRGISRKLGLTFFKKEPSGASTDSNDLAIGVVTNFDVQPSSKTLPRRLAGSLQLGCKAFLLSDSPDFLIYHRLRGLFQDVVGKVEIRVGDRKNSSTFAEDFPSD
jgi:hypothetical protein